MNQVKLLFQQVLMISTAILFIIGINGLMSHLKGTDFNFEWYYPFSFLLLGVLCALPTSLFIFNGVFKKPALNLLFHFLSTWVIAAVIGWTFHWYYNLKELLIITIQDIGVYIFVWAATVWIIRVEDKKINQALKDIQDKE